MSAAKHSPAPWKSHPIERRQGMGLPYVPVAAETLIAKVYSKHFGDDAQAEANGRLIAAAPELLEALQEIYEACDGYVPNTSKAMWNGARKAIDKATGEQP